MEVLRNSSTVRRLLTAQNHRGSFNGHGQSMSGAKTSTMVREDNDNREENLGTRDEKSGILYTVEDTPPWYLCVLLGFQHYLTALGAIISVPFLLSPYFCIDEDSVGLSELIGTIFFVSGVVTILQSTVGIRLPIVQGGTITFVTPAIAILSLDKWKCPYTEARKGVGVYNLTDLPEIGSEGHRDIWQARVREIQGAIMVASLFQVFLGFSGLMGFVLRFIGPLTITPLVALTALALFEAGASFAARHWWIAFLTMFLITLFSQYLKNIQIPIPAVRTGEGCAVMKLPIFKLFPVLLAMIVSWIVCAILTVTDVFPNDPEKWGYHARTDSRPGVIQKANWFRVPYPGQWGIPTVSTSGVFGMLPGVLAAMVESLGDYYACARLSGAPPPPVSAVNRGIGMEGIGCVLAGAWGSGNGTTSYSENIGAIAITKVGSRRVIQIGACFMLLLGSLGKFGALFATIPSPVFGGMFIIMFGMVTAVGFANLQYVDLNSTRNIFILGVSMFFGLSFPLWMQKNDAINTGSEVADQIISVLLSTGMFVGGLVGFVLDNTIPGTDEERGLQKWRNLDLDSSGFRDPKTDVYSIHFIQKYLDKLSIFRFVPFCPSFGKKQTQTSTESNFQQRTDKRVSAEDTRL